MHTNIYTCMLPNYLGINSGLEKKWDQTSAKSIGHMCLYVYEQYFQ